ncbi:hypothetical protein [Fredinandcohnia sp. FSL W7-1320]|uniref:hypothetical protein n=1 Tax=Fredinandcohnia sp. FSL W7-1320 TaxID=2954540 RepID=UPI0030FDEF76
MSRRFNDNFHFPPITNRLNNSYDFVNNYVSEQSNGVTVVVEKVINYSFIGENPLVQIESNHVFLESQLTSKVVAFIPGFKNDDYINITISGNKKDIEHVMVYELLEDPTGENFLYTEMKDE